MQKYYCNCCDSTIETTIKLGNKKDKPICPICENYCGFHNISKDEKIDLEKQIEYKEGCKSSMENEGFDYCFMSYSDFEEIEDEEFHKLRKNYCDSQKKLEEYINKNF